ncbi:protein-L-isoaspartate(D-aspartate) O-methyltransferase [soil metagenome]
MPTFDRCEPIRDSRLMPFRRPGKGAENLIQTLVDQGVTDPRVLSAIRSVPRNEFVAEGEVADAWINHALPIGFGQTISQPYVVAIMTEALSLTGNERVLEIGTGSGYQTAILSRLAAEVVSIERVPQLAERAHNVLHRLGITNVEITVGDGSLGWPERAPYNAVIVTAGAPQIPAELISQLEPEHGRLVVPTGPIGDQELLLVKRQGERIEQSSLGAVAFVPLIGEHGWNSQ